MRAELYFNEAFIKLTDRQMRFAFVCAYPADNSTNPQESDRARKHGHNHLAEKCLQPSCPAVRPGIQRRKLIIAHYDNSHFEFLR
jgi:hypothetical protein